MLDDNQRAAAALKLLKFSMLNDNEHEAVLLSELIEEKQLWSQLEDDDGNPFESHDAFVAEANRKYGS